MGGSRRIVRTLDVKRLLLRANADVAAMHGRFVQTVAQRIGTLARTGCNAAVVLARYARPWRRPLGKGSRHGARAGLSAAERRRRPAHTSDQARRLTPGIT